MRYVVQECPGGWEIRDTVLNAPYSAPSKSLKVEMLFCELVNATHARLTEEATPRCEVGHMLTAKGTCSVCVAPPELRGTK